MKPVRVVCHPDIMRGAPCIEGTRVLVKTIVTNLNAGSTPRRILKAYPSLPPGAIRAAIVWTAKNKTGWRLR